MKPFVRIFSNLSMLEIHFPLVYRVIDGYNENGEKMRWWLSSCPHLPSDGIYSNASTFSTSLNYLYFVFAFNSLIDNANWTFFFPKKYIFILISFYTAVYLCMSGYDDGILYTSHANLPIACTISSHFDIFYVIFSPVVFIEWCDKIIRFLLRNSFQMNSNDNKQRMHLITTDNKLCQWVRSFDSIFILDIRIVHSALTA